MNALLTPWRQLVQRRLWPVALLLLAGLAAVPYVLAKEPEPVPAAPTASVGKDQDDPIKAEPIVAMASVADRAKPRKLIGARKNPFAPDRDAIVKASKQDKATSSSADGADGKPSGGDGNGGTTVTGGSQGGGTAPGVVSPGDAPVQKPRPAPYSLTVRFGDSGGGALERMNVKRLEPLPSREEPVLVYLRTKADGTAVFLVEADVVAQGDGECRPHPNTCETIELREDETEFFDVVDESGNVTAQYQLDLLEIHVPKGASAARAAKASRRALRSVVRDAGPLGSRYGAGSGTLDHATRSAASAVAAGLGSR